MSKADRFRALSQSKESTDTAHPAKGDVINQIVGSITDDIPNDQKNFSTQNNSNTTQEDSSGIVNNNTETKQSSSTLNNNTSHTNSNVTDVSNTNTEQYYVTQSRKNRTTRTIPRPIEEFEQRLKRPTIEETHTRATWLVRNDLLKRMDKLAKHQPRGFKTHVVNFAIEKILDELEGK